MASNKAGVATLVDYAGRSNRTLPFSTSMYGRVYDILLSEDVEKADAMGVPRGTIGAIQFRFLNNNTVDESTPTQTALYYGPHNKAFPIKNEIVEIVSGPTTKAFDAKGNTVVTYYYKGVVDVWNNIEHNSINDVSFTSKDGPITGLLKERGGVGKLEHLPGDVIEEGRYGNSIRLGSSNSSSKKAPWRGPDGSPVTVIRNGQGVKMVDLAGVIFEDINSDGTSLYFLSEQTINFNPASFNFSSYNQTVEKINTTQPTVVLPDTTSIPNEDSSAVVSDLKEVSNIQDQVPITYKTTSGPSAIEDELSFIPDREPTEFFPEFEDMGVRHTDEGSDSWRSRISSYETPPADYLTENDIAGFSNYFIAYMQHQQGQAGLKAILYYAKQGSKEVPVNNPFTTDKNVQSKNIPSNVGPDFGDVAKTPGNFIKYWKKKFPKALSTWSNKKVRYEDILSKYSTKYGVDLNLIKAICSIESSFNPNEKTGSHYGLFQLTYEEFHKVYPGDNDILNPDKNANVGIQKIRSYLGSVGSILKIVK